MTEKGSDDFCTNCSEELAEKIAIAWSSLSSTDKDGFLRMQTMDYARFINEIQRNAEGMIQVGRIRLRREQRRLLRMQWRAWDRHDTISKRGTQSLSIGTEIEVDNDSDSTKGS